jgi:putative lipoic acid-binding regulatory protein
MKEDLIEFPCDYPVKAMGYTDDGFEAHVISLVSRHAELTEPRQLSSRSSSGGKYTSITVSVWARSREHLELVYANLKEDDKIVYIL